jgi:hypothetical protein
LAEQLSVDPDKIHVVSPFMGGAFGSLARSRSAPR